MKYPKKWIEAVPIEEDHRRSCLNDPGCITYWREIVLASLQEAGALKDPPKPREWHMCSACWRAVNISSNKLPCGCHGEQVRKIHVREVEEE